MSTILFQRPEFSTVMIRIPKTGSTSIVWGIFDGITDSDVVVHAPPPLDWLREYFSFAFIRNPFDRMVSAYLMFKKYPTETAEEKDFRARLTIDLALDVILDETQPLNEENYFSKLRRHLIPMTHPFFGLSQAANIYRFEEFETAYQELCERFNRPFSDLPHMRKTDRLPYTEYFNSLECTRARKIFAKDCETFGYHF